MYISGGSSSGSAVAVARGLVTFSLGTDTAGSGRVPAAFNNIVGLKPTKGLSNVSNVTKGWVILTNKILSCFLFRFHENFIYNPVVCLKLIKLLLTIFYKKFDIINIRSSPGL